MGKMTLRMHQALKATLDLIQYKCQDGILCYGANTATQETFCKPIAIAKASKRILSCTRIEIRGIGYYTNIESKFVEWLKNHIRLPTNTVWSNMASPHNWLKYNVADNLSILNVGIGHVDYYIIMRDEYLQYFRYKAFK